MTSLPIPFTGSTLELAPPAGSWSAAVGFALGALAVPISLALMAWLYRRELRLVSRRVALTLLILRAAAVFVVLFTLLFDPVVVRTTTEQVPGRVLVAFDTSDSMRISDPHRTVAEKLRLLRALKLAADVYSDSELATLIEQAEKSGLPEFPPADSPPGRRARERLAEAVKRLDDLTRLGIAVRAVGPEGSNLLAALKEKHAVEAAKFDQLLAGVSADDEGLTRALTPGNGLPVATARPSYTDLKLPLIHASQTAVDAPDSAAPRLLGVIVLTDGRHNWGESPLPLAGQLGRRTVPVFPVLVAPEAPPPDVTVVAARPQTATVFKGSIVPVEVEVRVAGWPAGPVKVSLELPPDGAEPRPPVTETIDHTGTDAVYRLTLRVKLDAPGPQSLKVTAEGEGREDRFPGNNTRTARVNVVKDRARVLLIDGDARWEFYYLHTCLGRAENMDVRSVVFRQPRVTRATDEEVRSMGLPAREMPADPDTLTSIDCVVIGDVEPGQFPPAERERVERYVADTGGTLVMVAGKRAMPLAYAGREDDPFRKLLPVRNPKEVDEPNGFRLALTPDADRAWFLRMADAAGESREAWDRFPPHFWAAAGEAKDGAEVLAAVPGKPPRQAAVIARQNYGFGRVLYVGVDSTWRWRYKVGDYYHHRFWGQVAQWAASDRLLPTVNATGTIRFGTREPAFRAGQDVEFVVRATEAVRKLTPQALKGAKVIRLPAGQDGKETPAGLVPLTTPEGRPRELTATLRDVSPGRYAVELDVPEWADQLRGPPGPDGRAAPLRARFDVLPPDGEELVELSGNRELLEQVAAASGGKVYTPETLGDLAEGLAAQAATCSNSSRLPDGEELVELSGNRELLEQVAAASGGKVYTPETLGDLAEGLAAQAATRQDQVRRPARQSWWVLGLFAALLTLEWALRKGSGLP
jgi:hypothetical protein